MTFARHALCRHWCIWRAGGSYRTSLGSTWCHLAETKGPLHTGWPASYIAAMMVALVVRSKVQAVEWKCWIWMTQVNLGQILRIINYILRLWWWWWWWCCWWWWWRQLVVMDLRWNSPHFLGKIAAAVFIRKAWFPIILKGSFLKLPEWWTVLCFQSET